MTSTEVLTLANATVCHRHRAETVVALDDVSLVIRAGETVAIVGPSGSGKTTLLDVLVGWRRLDEGTVSRHGGSPSWDDTAVVPQSLGLLEELTLAENISLPERLGAKRRSQAGQLANTLGLTEILNRRPPHVSLGEQQRAAVARALAGHPRILVADEPTAHQDEPNAALIATEIRTAATQGCAVVIATHDERILDGFDRVERIRDGRLLG